ncbi:MAG: AMP-binding protein, partial [Bradymonadaceae bacterium]
MFSASEHDRLLEEWGSGPQIDAPTQPVHRVFEQRVEEHPESTALRFDNEEWTYRQLNRRANRVAERLDQLAVRPGVPVGVSIKRSPKLVATMLGVWKAGGTYVPLEPSLPEPRLTYILSDL